MRDPVPTRVAWAAAGARRASLKPPVSGPGQRDALQALPHWAQHRGRRRGHCGGSEARAAKPRPPAGYQAPPFTLQPSAAQARVNLSRNKLTAGKKAIASCQDEAWVSVALRPPPCPGTASGSPTPCWFSLGRGCLWGKGCRTQDSSLGPGGWVGKSPRTSKSPPRTPQPTSLLAQSWPDLLMAPPPSYIKAPVTPGRSPQPRRAAPLPTQTLTWKPSTSSPE